MKTEKDIVVNGNTTVVKFTTSETVRSSDLIIFTKEYLEYVPELLKKIEESIGHTMELRLTRMKLDGEIQEKIISAHIVDILDDKTFKIKTNEDLTNNYDYLAEIIVRVDNPLGLVPTLPERDYINIYRFDSKELNKRYFSFLYEMKDLLRSFIGKDHAATITYIGCGPDSRKKIIDCYINKVNKSNIELTHTRSRVYVGGKLETCDLGVKKQIILNINPEYFLSSVAVTLNSKHNISPYDEGEIF